MAVTSSGAEEPLTASAHGSFRLGERPVRAAVHRRLRDADECVAGVDGVVVAVADHGDLLRNPADAEGDEACATGEDDAVRVGPAAVDGQFGG